MFINVTEAKGYIDIGHPRCWPTYDGRHVVDIWPTYDGRHRRRRPNIPTFVFWGFHLSENLCSILNYEDFYSPDVCILLDAKQPH